MYGKYSLKIWQAEPICWTQAGLGRQDGETNLCGAKKVCSLWEMCVFSYFQQHPYKLESTRMARSGRQWKD